MGPLSGPAGGRYGGVVGGDEGGFGGYVVTPLLAASYLLADKLTDVFGTEHKKKLEEEGKEVK